MTDFGNNLSEEEQAFELVEHLRLLTAPDTRGFLEDHQDDIFRQRHLDVDNARGIIMKLSSSFLVERVDRIGRPTDWQVTDRAEYLMEAQDRVGAYITENEADAIQTVGIPVWRLPHNSEGEWKVREIDEDLSGPELRVLFEVGLIRRESAPEGHAHTWKTSERLDDLRDAIGAIQNA